MHVEKNSKLIRICPEHFAPIYMISNKISYEKIFTVITTEISRRKGKGSEEHCGVNIPMASVADATKANRGNGIQGGIVNKSNGGRDSGLFWVCGGAGHCSKDL